MEGRINRALVTAPTSYAVGGAVESMGIQSEGVAQHLARARGFEGGSRNGRTLKSPLFSFWET